MNSEPTKNQPGRSRRRVELWINVALVVFVVLLAAYLVYHTLVYRFDERALDAQNDATLEKLGDNDKRRLLNGSGINNIPGLKLVTPNKALALANECANGPVYYGEEEATDADCVRLCSNSSAQALHVPPGTSDYIFDSKVLRAGTHCRIGERPECNLRTSYVIMTINSVVCRSKFPRLVGGPTGTTVVACNDQYIHDPQNVLWDGKVHAAFDPYTVDAQNEDELLPGGGFRFTCRFRGMDERRNVYQEHPADRLRPIKNYCAHRIFAAHPAVKTIFSDKGASYICECGREEDTRVRHLNPDDPTSVCSQSSHRITHDVKDRYLQEVPYDCFTMFSPITDVTRLLPCPDKIFTSQGPMQGSVTVPFSTKDHELIEHPRYADLKGEARVFWNQSVS
jgi:hypothetical protein